MKINVKLKKISRLSRRTSEISQKIYFITQDGHHKDSHLDIPSEADALTSKDSFLLETFHEVVVFVGKNTRPPQIDFYTVLRILCVYTITYLSSKTAGINPLLRIQMQKELPTVFRRSVRGLARLAELFLEKKKSILVGINPSFFIFIPLTFI